MPRKPWTPLPHEAEMFCNLYIDESSQTKHRYLVIGGLIVPLAFSDSFDAAIVSARENTISPAFRPNGEPRVMKWEKVNGYNFEAYKAVIDAYFKFPETARMPSFKHVDIHCVAVDTSKKSLKDSGDGDVEIGFHKEIYFLTNIVFGGRFKKELFHVYPDRRTSKQSLETARKIMNYGAKKYGDQRLWPFRRLQYKDPETCQALQVVDIFIGALAYRLNGHYDAPGAKGAKKKLCDYILLDRMRMTNPFVRSAYYRRRFTVTHRDGTTHKKR
jgi:hypothetical protein